MSYPVFQDTQPAVPGQTLGVDPWHDFRVADPVEVLRLLKLLRDGSVGVSLSSPQGHSVSSQLWSLDTVHAQLNFSANGDNLALQGLAQCDEAVAVAYLDSIKLQFDLNGLMLVQDERSRALRARRPTLLYRFQRRTSYRVRTIERNAPQARLRHPSIPDMQLVLRVLDVGAGGCALILPNDMPGLQPGSMLHGARLELDADTMFDVTLRLQHVSSMQQNTPGHRLGCEFVDLSGPAQRTLQRYIDRTQQRRRALVRG
jgi:c-di-GMP-binding flagellar brake protein YcgR